MRVQPWAPLIHPPLEALAEVASDQRFDPAVARIDLRCHAPCQGLRPRRERHTHATLVVLQAACSVSRARRGNPLGAGGRRCYASSGLIPEFSSAHSPNSPRPIIGTHKISTTPTPARNWWVSFRVEKCLSSPTN